MKKLILCTLGTLALTGCGKDDPAPAQESSSSAVSDFNQVYEQLAEANPEMGGSLLLARKKGTAALAPMGAFGGMWTDNTTGFSQVSSSLSSLNGFVSDLLTETVSQSPIERARMPFLMACCMDILSTKDSDGLFVTGTHTVTFSSAVVGVCGSSSDFSGMIGQDFTVTITTLGDRTNYDQKVFFDHASNPMFSTEDQWMFIKNTDSVLNFIHVSDESSTAFDGSKMGVNAIAYDKSTNTGSYQYFYTNDADNEVKLFRIFLDQTNDDARLFAYKKSGGSNQSATVSIASTFDAQTEMALSMSWDTQGGGGVYPDTVDAEACITTSDGSISAGTDGSPTCSATISKTALSASGAAALQTEAENIIATGIKANAVNDGLASFTPSFNAAGILGTTTDVSTLDD